MAKQLYLNGFWTGEFCLEDDLLEQFPNDAWARLGVRNAARDLVAIRRAAFELMQAKRQDILQQVDSEMRERLFWSVRDGSPVDTDWEDYTAGWLQAEYMDLFREDQGIPQRTRTEAHAQGQARSQAGDARRACPRGIGKAPP